MGRNPLVGNHDFHQYLLCRISIQLHELFIWLIGFLFWVLPGQPEPNQYGNPPFMTVNRTVYEPIQTPISNKKQEGRKTVRKRRKKR